MATITTKINTFSGGTSADLREKISNQYSITKNFDTFSNPKRLTPFRALEANEDKDFNIIKFLNANSQIYGFGVNGQGSAVAKVYKKSGNLVTSSWTEDQAVEGNGARNEKVFFEYKNYIYMWERGAELIRHGDITGTATNADYQSITYANVAQPVHHPADDIAYFFHDNKVSTLNDSTFAEAVLTLPSNLIITAGAAYGNFLAIACKNKNASGNDSIVFLWDRDSSVTTLSDKIDWGLGELVSLDVLDGTLVGISNVDSGTLFGIKPRIHIKVLSGNRATLIKELKLDSTVVDANYNATGDTWIRNSKLYFSIESDQSLDALDYTGIWVIGRHEINSPLATTMEYKVDTDSLSDQIHGFAFFGGYLFVAHSSDGSVDRINDQATYSTAVYESQIFDGEDSSLMRKLIGATVTTVPLPTAGQVVLKYRKDEETSFTTIFTEATDNSISHSAINIESSGISLPTDYKEIQFRIESTGGAEITGFSFKEEVVGKRTYD